MNLATSLGRRVRSPFLVLALALSVAAAACGNSGSSGITCMNPPATGPESEACASCGATQCPSEQAAVMNSCASLVSCIEACTCGTGVCEQGCFTAASSQCQKLITTFGDCEKQAPACAKSC